MGTEARCAMTLASVGVSQPRSRDEALLAIRLLAAEIAYMVRWLQDGRGYPLERAIVAHMAARKGQQRAALREWVRGERNEHDADRVP